MENTNTAVEAVKLEVVKKLTKEQKKRMGVYDTVVEALEVAGLEVLGKSKKGLVLEGGTVEIAVVLKKTAVTEFEDYETLEQYEARFKAYKAQKEEEEEEE